MFDNEIARLELKEIDPQLVDGPGTVASFDRTRPNQAAFLATTDTIPANHYLIMMFYSYQDR